MSYIEFEGTDGYKYRVDQQGNLEYYPGQGIEPITISYPGLEECELNNALEGFHRINTRSRIKEPIIIGMDCSSTSKERVDIIKSHEDKTSADDFKKALNRLEKRLDESLKDYKSKMEKKMSKFKVGDIVRVKSVDEMWKSDIMAKSLEKYACTQHRVNTIHIICGRTLYVLDDCDGVYFDESMLEDRVYTKDDICDINVIVPDKVVAIEFYDGKEKMVCHENDTFDLRKCCFIAIAKHLYKKEYTQEGIEYMATQLTYQKKYVKIVDTALKAYAKKEKDKEVAEKERIEREKITARQREKRRKYKERRTQRYREDMIDLIADSINEAKKRRKQSM